MTGSGDNTLKLNLDDLLDASTSTRARLPVPVCSKAVILLALMIIVSSPRAMNQNTPLITLAIKTTTPLPAL
jgi:hypothetical protein